MKQYSKMLAAALLASAALGGGSAWAAPISEQALKTIDNRWMVEVSTAAGDGSSSYYDAAQSFASFRQPSGIAVKPDGTVLITDTRNHVVRSLSASGSITTFSGLVFERDELGLPLGAMLDSAEGLALFNEPQGIVLDKSGNVYVADSGNHAIRKITPAGHVSTIAGSGEIGSEDGQGAEAAFYRPTGIAVADDGTMYVTDTLNHVIRSISPAGVVMTLTASPERAVQVFPGHAEPGGDYKDGDIRSSLFNEPTGIAIDGKGNLYVSDSGNQRIRYIDFQQNKVTTVAGSSLNAAGNGLYEQDQLYAEGDYADGPALQAKFHYPMGLALTEEGGLLIADSQNHSIRYLLNGQVTTLAGANRQGTGTENGIEGVAAMHRPADVAVTADGTVLVADSYNNKLRAIRLYQLPEGLADNNQVKVVLESEAIRFDAAPEITNGRTMVPVRAITEALGYEVSFDSETQAVQLSKNGTTVELYIGQTGVRKLEEGKEPVSQATDAALYTKQDRTYVPVRFFAEQIGLDVQWINERNTVILRQPVK